MARDDWYRNSTWSEAVAARFEEKLERSRNKHQYLRIQATALIRSHAEIALKLLERYFSLGDSLDAALAYQARADACLALDRVDEAIAAYEATLTQEALRPTVQTWTSVDYPYLVAVRNLSPYFGRVPFIPLPRTLSPARRRVWNLIAKRTRLEAKPASSR